MLVKKLCLCVSCRECSLVISFGYGMFLLVCASIMFGVCVICLLGIIVGNCFVVCVDDSYCSRFC